MEVSKARSFSQTMVGCRFAREDDRGTLLMYLQASGLRTLQFRRGPTSLENAEHFLPIRRNKSMLNYFVDFVRGMLAWRPEDR
jgi:hypothetical protein